MAEIVPATAGPAPSGADDNTTMLELLALVGAAQARGGTDLDHLPKRLSPSRASDFAQCPQLFYYKTICGIATPNTIATTRGSIAHGAFERIFDHPAGERTPEIACTYIRPTWEEMVNPTLDEDEFPEGSDQRRKALERAADYRQLAPEGSDVEADLLATAEQMVRNWFLMERANNFSPLELELPDGRRIDGRELHVAADMFGVNLHGFIDRLDRWVAPNGEVVWSISDYKTGKVPGEGKKYSKATMDRIRYESFFAMRVYAVLCQEMLGITPKYLRLIYVKTGDRDQGIKPLRVTDKILRDTKEQVRAIWKGITKSAQTGQWETRTGPLCNFCDFHDICPAFNPELVGLVNREQMAG
jgi:putative RecB family exonuclease